MGSDPRGAAAEGAHAAIGDLASRLNAGIDAGELAELAARGGFGDEGPAATRDLFAYLADGRHQAAIEMPPRLGGLPRRAPKAFEGLDLSRVQGRDAAALRKLPSPSDPHARKDIALTGPGGMGKTHLAQAHGHECRARGYKTHCLKAGEPRDELAKAAERGGTARAPGTLVRPSCPMVDEVGRRVLDKACTDLFLDVVDRRHEKGGPSTLTLTGNTPANDWDGLLTGDDALPCAPDGVFDKASVFVMRGPSLRGAGCVTFSVESVPSVTRVQR